jgi:hypothetical protein
VLKSAVRNAKLGREDELAALKRLDDQARLVECHTSSPPVEAPIAEERSLSDSYAGRSVFGWEFPPRDCIAVDSAGGHSGSGPIIEMRRSERRGSSARHRPLHRDIGPRRSHAAALKPLMAR